MTESKTWKPLALMLCLGLLWIAAMTRLIPTEYRAFNFTAIGAVAMFAAARIGLWQSLLITFTAMLTSGIVLWWQNDFHEHYEPFPSTYLGLACYSLIAWLFLRNSENPVRIGAVALLGSWWFFLVTNAFSWVSPMHNYERNFMGLVDCYTMALPFYRTTLAGDMIFTGVLFGLHALLSRAYFPAERVALIPVQDS
ncbi:hypothetical protein BH11PLA2_BH11PLA2_00610 [soil metagenome]